MRRRLTFGASIAAALAVAGVACQARGGAEPATRSDEVTGEPARVPDPPPRYAVPADAPAAEAASDDGVSTGAPSLECRKPKPFLCTLEDGTPVCSEVPCLPSCDRVGCVGGDVCRACDGGFRCLAPGDGC